MGSVSGSDTANRTRTQQASSSNDFHAMCKDTAMQQCDTRNNTGLNAEFGRDLGRGPKRQDKTLLRQHGVPKRSWPAMVGCASSASSALVASPDGDAEGGEVGAVTGPDMSAWQEEANFAPKITPERSAAPFSVHGHGRLYPREHRGVPEVP